MNEKIRLDETSLTVYQILSKTFHLICSPSRCISLVKGIKLLRQIIIDETAKVAGKTEPLKPMDPPLFVWEPVPDSCKPSELPNVLEAMKYVDVMSPNYLELTALFSEETKMLPFLNSIGACEMDVLEWECDELLKKGFGEKPSAVVVRLGDQGCYVASHSRHVRFPAYFEPKTTLGGNLRTNRNIVDPTGAGNAFLGGLCIGLLPHADAPTISHLNHFERGAVYGTIAASFAVQQIGMPTLGRGKEGGEDGHMAEQWNGESLNSRLTKYRERLRPVTADHVGHQDHWDPEASTRRWKAWRKQLGAVQLRVVSPEEKKRSELYHGVRCDDPVLGPNQMRIERR